MTFGERIQKFRKELNMTQNELAEKLFISYQAVSQWENGVTKPDIDMLPKLANIFNVTIDELFNDEKVTRLKGLDLKDDTLYIVVSKGDNILDIKDYHTNKINDNVTIQIEGDLLNVYSSFSLKIDGGIEGDVSAGTSIVCGGINGDVTAGDDVTCGGVCGDVTAGSDINCGGIIGEVNAGNDLKCKDIQGNVKVNGNIECHNIESENIETKGEIFCDGKISNNKKVQNKITIK